MNNSRPDRITDEAAADHCDRFLCSVISVHGTNRLLKVGQSMSALPRYFRHQLVPLLPKHRLLPPRYLTVLSILVWPSRSWTALRLPVRR
jgi:hypothetical protein